MQDRRHQQLADRERQAHGPGRQRVALARQQQDGKARDEIPGARERDRARQRADGGEHAERTPAPATGPAASTAFPARTSRASPPAARRRHRREETARPPDGSWHRRGPNDAGASGPASRSRSTPPTTARRRPSRRKMPPDERSDRRAREIEADRGEQRHAAGGGDGGRTIAAKRRAGGDLAANGEDVGQRLVEVAHLDGCLSLNFVPQSIPDAKQTQAATCADAGGARNWVNGFGFSCRSTAFSVPIESERRLWLFFDAFSLREPEPTSLENAPAGKMPESRIARDDYS